MIVPIDDIISLLKICPNDFSYVPIEDIFLHKENKLPKRLWEAGSRIPEKIIPEFQAEGVAQIDLLFTNPLYKMLNVINPQRYKQPATLKTFIEIDRIISTFRQINKVSKRKRYISFLSEMYNLNDSGFNPIIRFNEIIDDDKWNHIKSKINKIKKDGKFPIIFNEIGIIICVDLTQQGDNNYIERFKKNADLCSILVINKSDNKNFCISSEFNAMTDIWTVNDPGKLLDTYIEKNARLIIVGDTINETYKSALLQIKNYDRFARFFIATKINPNSSNELLMSIKNAYHKNNYKFD